MSLRAPRCSEPAGEGYFATCAWHWETGGRTLRCRCSSEHWKLEDPQPLVRGHAAWALGRLGSAAALDAVASRSTDESDPFVLDEVALSLRV